MNNIIQLILDMVNYSNANITLKTYLYPTQVRTGILLRKFRKVGGIEFILESKQALIPILPRSIWTLKRTKPSYILQRIFTPKDYRYQKC